MAELPRPRWLPSRGSLTVVLVAGTLGVTGYFLALRGTQQTADASRAFVPAVPAVHGPEPQGVAPSYGEIIAGDKAALAPRSEWAGQGALVHSAPDVEVYEGRPARLAAALQARATRRAYDGAPPVIPHAIGVRDVASCLSCHMNGLTVDGRLAPPMSHPAYSSCTQCHAPVGGPHPWFDAETVEVESVFEGRASAGAGTRAWAGAPPTVPHAIHMRETCASCHGPNGAPGLRTTHPERQQCLQCHVPDARLDPTGLLEAHP